jgi:periplasmic protein TonB
MRLWLFLVASALIHAALLNIPIRLRSIQEPECLEMRFVMEAARASQEANPQPVPPLIPVPDKAVLETPPETVKVPEMPLAPEPPKKKAAPKPKANPLPKPTPEPLAEPVQPVEDARSADVSMPRPNLPAVTAAAADSKEGPAEPAGGRNEKQMAAVSRSPTGGSGTGPVAFGTSGGPGFIRRVLPRYPRLARETGREGTVMLSLTIDEQGILQSVEVVESAGYGFDEEALQAIRSSTFKAAVRNGKTVASRAMLPVRFILRGSGND